jgi:hypothetical protein
MIYSSIKTHYLSAESGDRLVRYDIIATDSDTYLVKVIDEQKARWLSLNHYYSLISFM